MPPADVFAITTGSSEPIYRQLIEQVKRQIAAGSMKTGDEVPSVREVAQVLAVNPMTVSKAYALLEAEGVLERRRGLAMVVSAQHGQPQAAADRVELLRPALERAAAEARQLQLSTRQVLALFKSILESKEGPSP